MSSDQRSPDRGAMTIAQFCAWSGIGRTLTYQLINYGHLNAVKVGRRRLILWSEAQRWLASLPKD